MKKIISNSTILALLIGGSFLAGVLITKTPMPDLSEQVKHSVLEILEYPESAEFRGVEYYFSKKIRTGGELGYMCGEVFLYKNDLLPAGYKRFVVKVFQTSEGIYYTSFPIIEDSDNAILAERIDDVWTIFCHNNAMNEEHDGKFNDDTDVNYNSPYLPK